MEPVELNSAQAGILDALIEGYLRTESPVTGEEIAEAVGYNPVTVRKHMGSLQALHLVEGVPGVKGGYRPTAEAYEARDLQGVEEPEPLPLARGYDRITATVERIEFPDVHDPDECRARIRFRRPMDEFEPGDSVLVGPTPRSNLVVGGVIAEVDEARTEIVIDVELVEAPFSDE